MLDAISPLQEGIGGRGRIDIEGGVGNEVIGVRGGRYRTRMDGLLGVDGGRLVVRRHSERLLAELSRNWER